MFPLGNISPILIPHGVLVCPDTTMSYIFNFSSLTRIKGTKPIKVSLFTQYLMISDYHIFYKDNSAKQLIKNSKRCGSQT